MQHPRLFRAICALLAAGLAVGLLRGAPANAQAQEGTAQLTAVDASAFPDVHAYLRVLDAAGARVSGLRPAGFSLLENGQPVTGLSVTEQDVGVQVVFVLDTTDSFSARDVNGITRLAHIQQALADFAEGGGLKPGLDDVTVLTNEGLVVEHAQEPAVIARAVQGYTTEFAGAADPFPLIERGLNLAATATRRPGMLRYLVFFSNGLNRPSLDGPITTLAEVANAEQVPIFTVFVGPTGAENTVGAQNLLRLAEMTGGQRFIFAGAGSLDPLFQRLADDGTQYRLSYRSGLATTGQHSLLASVAISPSIELVSNELLFPLRVEAPTVALPDLPASVVRVAPTHDADPAVAEPARLNVTLGLDFPDGHPRGARQTQLVVDGEVVATSDTATLAWPLAGYAEAAEHTVQARLIDELGLAAESDVYTVHVSLQVPAAPPAAAPSLLPESSGWPLLAAALLGVLVAVAIGALGWVAVVRRQAAQAEAAQAAAVVDETVPAVPVRRPAAPRAAPAPRRALQNMALPHLRWPGRAAAPAPVGPAYLEVVEPGGGGAPRADIDLAGSALTLGRDGALAEAVFHDRSVSRLHARIVAEGGGFVIYDEGSTSGTWVNYALISPEAGHPLEHGDLINLGRVQLRYRRRDVPPGGAAARVEAAAVTQASAAPAPQEEGA